MAIASGHPEPPNWGKMKRLLSIIIVAFILLLSSCAVNTMNEAGRINGTGIRNDEFMSAYRGHYSNFSFQNGRSPDKDEKQRIFNETWKNITRYIILKDYYAKYKITTTMREVLDTLSVNIPTHIVNSPLFKVNGKFDKQLYLQSLTTDRPENLAPLRRHYLENLIPIMKLKAKLIENELISSKESKQIARILASKADLELMIFDPAEQKVILSDAEISEFYTANISRFSLKPYHSLAYTMIQVVPAVDDQLISHTMADSVLTLLNKGISAEEIIRKTKSNSGLLSLVDHGYIKTDEIPEDLAFLLSSINDGAYSQVLRSELGWAIYHKVQSTKTLTHYRTLFIQTLASSSTLSTPETIASRVMSLAKSIGLAGAADEFGLRYISTGVLYADSLGFDAKDVKPAVLNWLATAPKGSVSSPFYSTELSAWLVLEAVDIQRKTVKRLSEVKEILVPELSAIRRNELNRQRARTWADSVNPNATNSQASTILKNVDMNSAWNGLPLGKIYYQAVYAHSAKLGLPVVEHKDLLIVPIVRSISYTNEKPSAEQIRAAYVQTLPDNWFDSWLDAKVKTAKVQINNAP